MQKTFINKGKHRTGSVHARLAALSTKQQNKGPDPPVLALAELPIIELDHTGTPQPPRILHQAPQGLMRFLPECIRSVQWNPGKPAALAVSFGVVVVLVVAGFIIWGTITPEPTPVIVDASKSSSSTATALPSATTTNTIVVSVVGKVTKPGLVTVPENSRVADAITAAGGVLPDVDIAELNMARRLTDGEQIRVGLPGATAESNVNSPAVKVNLNSASVESLDALPGVGPVTAQRIVQRRQQRGRFTSVDQLREIEGIGESRLNKLRSLVTI